MRPRAMIPITLCMLAPRRWLSGTASLPRFDLAGLRPNDRATLRGAQESQRAVVFGTLPRNLGQKMLPFVFKLASRYRDACDIACAANLAPIKAITPRHSFAMNGIEITGNGSARKGMFPEPIELRMMTIAPGHAPQDGA